jgi:hypothetical protein
MMVAKTILIGIDDHGEMAVGRAETEEQIARVRGLVCALANDEGEALTWEDFDNPEEPRTLFQAIARDRGRRIDRGLMMADRPPFAVVTAEGGRAVRLEFYEGHDALALVYDVRARELHGVARANYLGADPHAYDPAAFLAEVLGVPQGALEGESPDPAPAPSLICRAGLERYIVPGRRYHSALPPELEAAYCYTVDGGHSVIVVLENEYVEGSPVEGWLVPAPVRAVLRAGYQVRDGLVWCRLPYSSEVGLLTESEDDEY